MLRVEVKIEWSYAFHYLMCLHRVTETTSPIIIIIIVISFMQGIYTHIPETNYVPGEYGVAAILLFLFMMLI